MNGAVESSDLAGNAGNVILDGSDITLQGNGSETDSDEGQESGKGGNANHFSRQLEESEQVQASAGLLMVFKGPFYTFTTRVTRPSQDDG